MGSNAAENHPISMRWVLKAKKRGARLIVADPRFTRTASKADLYAPFRSGTDIAFLGGMINYILENNLYFKDYIVHYTNATFLVNPEFKVKLTCFRVITKRPGSTIKNMVVSAG